MPKARGLPGHKLLRIDRVRQFQAKVSTRDGLAVNYRSRSTGRFNPGRRSADRELRGCSLLARIPMIVPACCPMLPLVTLGRLFSNSRALVDVLVRLITGPLVCGTMLRIKRTIKLISARRASFLLT